MKLDYWGRLWTCIVWDESRAKFVDLRVDQIKTLRILPGLFVEERGKTLRDYEARGSDSRA